MILIEHHYQDMEVWVPYFRLVEEGATVHFIGTGSQKSYNGKYGYPVRAHFIADKVKPSAYDAIIIPGGWAPDFLRRYPAVINLVQKMDQAGKLIASICHGGWVLASANVLRNRKCTSFFAIKDDLIHAGAKYLDQEVVVDKNIITSRTPDDLPAFMREIVRALEG